jgi:hypothetical protein
VSSIHYQRAFEEAAKRFNPSTLIKPARQENRLGAERLFRSLDGLTGVQMEVHDHPGKRIALCCTRRAGKSYLAAPWIIELGMRAKNPETTMFFIAPTLEHAKALLWRRFEAVQQQTGIEFKMKSDPWRVEFPTGAILYFRGAKDLDQLGVLRGFATSLVWVDEVQDVRDSVLRHIEAAVGPSLRDNHGKIIFSGTPGPIAAGLWYEIASGKKPNWWNKFWSLFDNPHLDEDSRDINSIMRDEGFATLDDPRCQREYFARWVEDNTHRVYKYTAENNSVWKFGDPLPEGHVWQYSIGVDFGYSPDPSAVVVWAYSTTHRQTFCVYEFKQKQLSYTQLFEKGVKPAWDKYGPCLVVGDGANSQAIAEINERWGIGMESAKKNQKPAFIELMNSDFLGNFIQIPPGFDYAREMTELVWDQSEFPKRVEHKSRDNHLCDAALYAWRACKQWIGEKLPAPAQTFDTETSRAAYFLQQYLKGKQGHGKPRDWADDSQFYGDPTAPKLGQGSGGLDGDGG